jgi:hypothetical protein
MPFDFDLFDSKFKPLITCVVNIQFHMPKVVYMQTWLLLMMNCVNIELFD